jgi:hypothetical protein
MNRIRYVLPLPLLALLAVAGPATPAHADTLSPFSLTTEASDHEYASPGQELVVPWFVKDSGSDPLSITMSLTELVSLAWQSPAIGWTSLSVAAHARQRPVRGRAGRGGRTAQHARRQYAVNIMASASLPGCSGVCVGGAVAGTLVVYVAG